MSLLLAIFEKQPITEIQRILKEEQEGRIPKSNYSELLNSTLLGVQSLDKQDKKHRQEEITRLFTIAQLLVDHGASVNQKLNAGKPDGFYLLQFYFNLGEWEVVEFLLKNKADPCLVMNQEPLLRACIKETVFEKEGATLLIKYDYDINASGEYNATPVFKSIHLDNHIALEFLCQHKAKLDIPDKLGLYPLQEAIRYQNYQAIQILLKHGANPFVLTIKWMDGLASQKTGKAAFDFILKNMSEKLHNKGVIESLSLAEIQNIPFQYLNLEPAMLNAIQDRVVALVKGSTLSSELQEKLLSVLMDPKLQSPLKKLSKLNIIAECCQMLLKPDALDQQDTTLCGPASVISALLHTRPLQLIDFGFNLLFQGKTNQPLICDLSKHSRIQAYSMVGILLTELRRASNITGYSPASFREGLQGLTSPRLICKWLQAFGYSALQDHTFVLNTKGKPLTKPLQLTLDLMFFGFHQKNRSLSNQSGNFAWLLEQYHSGNEIILLLSGQLMQEIEASELRHYPDAHEVSHTQFSCCSLPIDHYVYLKSVKLLEGNKIHLQFWTWGKQYDKVWTPEEFLQIYRGVIVGQKPNDSSKTLLPGFTDYKMDGKPSQTQAPVLSSTTSMRLKEKSL